MIDIETAIRRCQEIVDDDSEIIVDVLMCSAYGNLEKWEDKGSTVNNYLRFNEIKSYNEDGHDVIAAK